MKKITKPIIAIFAIATTLVSCHKEDTTDSVQGNWNIDSVVVGATGISPQTINPNGDCTTKSYYNLKTASSLEVGSVDPENNCEVSTANGSWKQTGKSLQLTVENETETFTITSITASKLVLKITDPKSLSQDGTGTDVAPGAYAELHFSK